VKRFDLLGFDNRDFHNPMDESTHVHVESLGEEKACPNFFKPARRFDAKIVPPETTHGMSECSSPTLM
jgi:hypothetical protein